VQIKHCESRGEGGVVIRKMSSYAIQIRLSGDISEVKQITQTTVQEIIKESNMNPASAANPSFELDKKKKTDGSHVGLHKRLQGAEKKGVQTKEGDFSRTTRSNSPWGCTKVFQQRIGSGRRQCLLRR